jgi:hypothetical protein
MGAAQPLLHASSQQIDLGKAGQPRRIDLVSGRTGQGDLQVASWIGNSGQRRFDWHYELSMSGGGLIEREGEFDFEAPTDGYKPMIQLNMAADDAKWSSDLTTSYFAKFPDGTYGRFLVKFYPGDRNFIVIESYVNPTPGSRNLEFDPAKEIKAR